MKKLGPYTIKLDKCPQILGYASAAGKKEGQGPLQNRFDIIFTDPYIGAESFEKAESLMQNKVAQKALTKAGISAADIDFIFAGDLLNQCAGSHYGMRGMDAAFIGLYGACSTMAQSLALASLFVEAGFAGKTLAVTSSHYCASERQFRFPLEYGGQRPPTSQCTVTGAGAVIVSDIPFTEDVSPVSGKSTPYVKGVTFGKIVDLGITDQNNMGAAMAPAACETIKNFLSDTNTNPDNYDLILTGDLGQVGSELLLDLMKRDNIDISNVHKDCGMMIFDMENQDVHAGGSGCGAGAAVLCSTILKDLTSGHLDNVLFAATGALMSPTAIEQGETIPGIAHLVHISNTMW